MTPDGKAREIAKIVASLLNYEPALADTNYAAVIEELTVALRECRDEAIKEAVLFERSDAGMALNWKDGFDKGLEEAAKICDQRKEDRYASDCAIEAEAMAKDIRAKKSGEQSGTSRSYGNTGY